MNEIPGQVYLTRALVAARYSVSDRTVSRWQTDSNLNFPKGLQVNGRHLIPLAELETWERSRASTKKAA